MKNLFFLLSFLFLLTACGKVENTDATNENTNNIISSDIVDVKENTIDVNTNSSIDKEYILDVNADSNIEEDLVSELVPTDTSLLSNSKCAWGFVRKKDGNRPEFYGPHSKVLDENEGIYIGNKDNKVLYLTFDEGYENGYTGQILDTLKEKNVKAIFFVTMPYVKQNPDLIRRMIDEGHIVGNHTVNHPSMPDVTDDDKLRNEIMELHNYIKENFNYEMCYLRPPKGEFSERTVRISLDLGYRTVLWSSAYDDWDTKKQDRLDYARGMIENNFHNGSVMLLHAVSKDNTALLGEIIDEARNRGYEFKTLDEFER